MESKKPRHCKMDKCLVFGLIMEILLNISDFINDWLFYVDVNSIQMGLVYGPRDSKTRTAVTVFCSLGTIFFLLEIADFIYTIHDKGSKFLHSDILIGLVILLEDFPQLVISFQIILCGEQPISIFQMVRAVIMMIAPFIYVIYIIVEWKKDKDGKKIIHKVLKVLNTVGTILLALGGVAIFVLTYSKHDASGTFIFRTPESITEEAFEGTHGYFSNVSIFIQHSEQLFPGTGGNGVKTNDNVTKWLRLNTIDKVRFSESSEVSYKIEYESIIAGTVVLAVLEESNLTSTINGTPHWSLRECYSIDQTETPEKITLNANCSQPGFFKNSTSLFIKFQYSKPNTVFMKQILGDITFNLMISNNGNCHEGSDEIPDLLHYFRTNETLVPDSMRHLLFNTTSGQFRFYRNEGLDMIDSIDSWKTGWQSCDSTGNRSPTWDNSLQMTCTQD